LNGKSKESGESSCGGEHPPCPGQSENSHRQSLDSECRRDQIEPRLPKRRFIKKVTTLLALLRVLQTLVSKADRGPQLERVKNQKNHLQLI
jgi:hypothetical protein